MDDPCLDLTEAERQVVADLIAYLQPLTSPERLAFVAYLEALEKQRIAREVRASLRVIRTGSQEQP